MVRTKYFLSMLLIFACFFTGCNTSSQQPEINNGTLDLETWDSQKDKIVKLKGYWEFYPNEFRKDFSQNSSPEYFYVPKNWLGIKPEIHFATYRVTIKLPKEQKNLAIKINSIKSAYKLFVDGKEISEMGKIGTSPDSTYPRVTSSILKLPEIQNQKLEIVLYVSDFHMGESGIWRDILLGPEEDIRRQGLIKDSEDLIFFGMFVIIGLYHLGLFSFRRDSLIYLHFGFFAILLGLRMLVIDERVLVRIFNTLHYDIYLKADFIVEFLAFAFFTQFLKALFPLHFPNILEKVLFWSFIVLSCFCLIIPVKVAAEVELIIRPIFIPCGIIFLYVFYQGLRNNIQENIIILISFIILFLTFANDILDSLNIIQTLSLSQYGTFLFILGLSMTLSFQLSRAFNESRMLTEQLFKVSNVKDEFMSNLSHELRTPLSLIYAYSELLGDNFMNDPETIHSYAKDIFHETNTLIEIINDLMLVTDLETKFHLKIEETEVEPLFKESILYLEHFVKEKGIRFDLSKVEPVSLKCDKGLITKVFIIIFKNSIFYGHTKGQITCRASVENGKVLIDIGDDGPGIKTPDIEKIFEKFYRIDSSITYKVSGVGVGLFIAKRIIEMHGGKIRANNRIQGGLNIHIEL